MTSNIASRTEYLTETYTISVLLLRANLMQKKLVLLHELLIIQ